MTNTTQPIDEETLTEKLAFAELLFWSTKRPAWQRDGLRRLMQKGSLDDADIEAMLELCLNPKLPHHALSEAHVVTQAAVSGPISVLRIENPTGINALAAGQKLEFSKDGITIIYGDNGSGKSGYVRVLKHACRSRDRAFKILPDVEVSGIVKQTANIVFARGEIEDAFAWKPDLSAHPDLSSVSIFDSRSANIHVEKTNAVAYIPQPMQVLEALADACDKIKEKLDAKVKEITLKTPLAIKNPEFSKDTEAGAFMHSLSAKSNVVELDLLATLILDPLAKLTDAELQRLSTLETDLAQDSKKAVAKITDQKSRFDDGTARLKEIVEASSDESFSKRDSLKADLDTKAEAAKLASDALFAASPLPDVGKSIWEKLWEAARKYSDDVAYPDKKFPQAAVGDDLCVLCQQPLGQEAVERRMTFEHFVKGSTKADEEAAKKTFGDAISHGKAARPKLKDIRQLANMISTEIGNVDLSNVVRKCGIRAAWRLRAYAKGMKAPGAEANFPQTEVAAMATQLTTRISQLSADQSSPEHLALKKEYLELKERKALAPLLADIKAEIERLKEIETIAASAKDTAKRSVTTKNKELSDKLVTNALRGRFEREIEKLKLSRMRVELRKIKDQNAVSYFQVCLIEKPNEQVGNIFSEGEHRCVALAAFLAELVTSKQYSSIVFDDPMSSLDHIHRKAVAARLVEEAAHRQVIVFTHDLAFLFELRREAAAKKRPVQYQTVCRKQNRPGFVEGELPMKAKSAWQLAQSLRSELKEAKPDFEKWPDARRRIFSKGIIEQLRETWDQGIADFVFPVLGRFDNTIKGNGLCKLAIINEGDVKTVTAARGRLSEEMHASAETLNPETVSLADLKAEVEKLEAWLDSIYIRQGVAKPPITSYA